MEIGILNLKAFIWILPFLYELLLFLAGMIWVARGRPFDQATYERIAGFHALRHAGASLMDNCNVPLGSIQRILGHENRTTTEIYLHSINQSEIAAMAVYEQARGKSHSDSHSIKGKGFRPDDLNPI